ncbi:hypothetical protein FHG87_014783 [Trinorchestia longiramus]|nr:hypothetical protein FHG87_014783 [Trinorchestia longiramus]
MSTRIHGEHHITSPIDNSQLCQARVQKAAFDLHDNDYFQRTTNNSTSTRAFSCSHQDGPHTLRGRAQPTTEAAAAAPLTQTKASLLRCQILTLDHILDRSPDHSPDHIHDHVPDHIPDHILDHIFDHILDHHF